MLFGLVAPALPSLSNSGKTNTAISGIAGTLEQARQYAVAQNTYVWVAFRQNASDANGGSLEVVVLASKSGIDPSPWADFGSVPNANIDLIGKIQTYPMAKLGEAGAFTAAQIPTLPNISPEVSSINNSPASTAVFKVNVRGQAVDFGRALQFTPSGEARNTSSPVNVIEFALQAMRGATLESHNIAVFRVNGFTGNTMVYRP
ncbi:MAG: Tfp pilus assembly protein FimT/FimU [Chthoniobacteraceae bacterium]